MRERESGLETPGLPSAGQPASALPSSASPSPVPLDAVEESPVWLELNGTPAVTWMCTPDALDDLVVGWLFGEGYIESPRDIASMRPCTKELGFWVEIDPARVTRVDGMSRRRILASGCGSVTAFLGSLADVPRRAVARPAVDTPRLRALFKELFALGERYKDTGGIHAAALTDGATLFHHAEDIGRHNAVDKVFGAALQAGRSPADLLLLVTGRISGELAFKAARAGVAAVATPSVPSTIAVDIARAAGMFLIGRAVSGAPQVHDPRVAR
ncbi:MAG TPA: formate dehydrogenase accessory sulfurtransferase FdhD [Gemmatimonadaceae bacterium]|nr:formate dehydrogenase accessory sulfurtransferase FdhD [Gemmatimonadaceae bacterium]